MQTHRILSGLTIFIMVALVAAGWFLVAQPQLAAASDASTQLSTVQSQIRTTQSTIAELKSEQKEIPSLKASLRELRRSIPTDVESSAYITGINDLAAQAGVTITAITVNDGEPYTPPVAASSATKPTGGASPSPSPTPSPSASPTAPAVSGWTAATDARLTGSNFILIPTSVGVKGDWPTTVAFIHGLQTSSRLFLVKGLAITHDTGDPTLLDTTITGFIYVILDPKSAALDKSDASAPTATPTPTPTPTSTVTPNPSGSSTPTPTTSPTP